MLAQSPVRRLLPVNFVANIKNNVSDVRPCYSCHSACHVSCANALRAAQSDQHSDECLCCACLICICQCEHCAKRVDTNGSASSCLPTTVIRGSLRMSATEQVSRHGLLSASMYLAVIPSVEGCSDLSCLVVSSMSIIGFAGGMTNGAC